MTCDQTLFLTDVKSHVMEVIRDDGVNRHIRFREPGTMIQHFDLITWPGYLCYTGDMGTYVFRRLHDMFEFFRTDRGIKPSYWSEKVEASDRDGVRKFSAEKFKANVMRWVGDRGLTGKLGHGLQDELDELFDIAESGDEGEAVRAAAVLQFNGRDVFPDFYEVDHREYTFRFLWCCYALAWGIQRYDEERATTATKEQGNG